jgi:hypothetical protein
MNELIPIHALTRVSGENEIKAYFQKVLELRQSGEEFPVNLELVCPLVYGRKEDAARELKRNFIENVDYKVLRKNAENPLGGRPTETILILIKSYLLSSNVPKFLPRFATTTGSKSLTYPRKML